MSEVLTHYQDGPLSYLRGGDGPPLLLLHGAPGSAHTWAQSAALLSNQYDVILPDLRGFGNSPGSQNSTHLDHDFYMEAHAETVQRLLDHLEVDSLFLGGHGFGGAVALTLVRLFPDLSPRGLALSSSNVFTTPPSSVLLQMADLPLLGRVALRLVTGTRTGLDALYHLAVTNQVSFPSADFERHLTPSSIRQTRRVLERSLTDLSDTYAEIEALLPHLEIPTIVLWGDQDPLFPVATAQQIVETLPDATVSVFDHTGHFVPEERPEMTAWHIDDFFQTRPSVCPAVDRKPSS